MFLLTPSPCGGTPSGAGITGGASEAAEPALCLRTRYAYRTVLLCHPRAGEWTRPSNEMLHHYAGYAGRFIYLPAGVAGGTIHDYVDDASLCLSTRVPHLLERCSTFNRRRSFSLRIASKPYVDDAFIICRRLRPLINGRSSYDSFTFSLNTATLMSTLCRWRC